MPNRRNFLKLGLTSFITSYANFSHANHLSLSSLPKSDGFYYPAEWLPHEYTIMQFVPTNKSKSKQIWSMTANALSEFEPVLMVVDPYDMRIAKKTLNRDIEIVEYALNDGWARDTAPLFVVNGRGKRRIVDFTFNGWGKKYAFANDAILTEKLSHYLQTPYYKSPLVAEGGAITQNGKGTIITTEECLLNKNRNPNKSKQMIDIILKNYLGAKKIIWLKKGLTPDPITDGHVDGICVFVDHSMVMLHTTNDKNDPNYPICQSAKQILLSETDESGNKLTIIELPLAYDVAHINFYIANDAVIVPILGYKKADDRALGIIEDTFPTRKIIGIHGTKVAKLGGGIHCITQQVPKI